MRNKNTRKTNGENNIFHFNKIAQIYYETRLYIGMNL